MKITVYFEAPAGAHEVAVFFDEIIYKTCVPALEAKAKAWGYVLSESVTYKEGNNMIDKLENLQALIGEIESADFATAHDLALTETHASVKKYIDYLKQYEGEVT